MNEEDFIKKLFSKTDLNYPVGDIEETIMTKIKSMNVYRKQQGIYALISKIGIFISIILSIIFTFSIGEADTLYLFLGMPLILLLLVFPFEKLLNQKLSIE